MSLAFRAEGHLSRFNIQAHWNETHPWPWGCAINFAHSVSISLSNIPPPPPSLLPHTFFMVSYRCTWWVLNPKSHPPSYSYKVRRCLWAIAQWPNNNPPPLILLKWLLLERVNLLASQLYKMSKMNSMKRRTKFTFLTRSTFLHLQLQLFQYDLHYAQKQKNSLLPWFMSPWPTALTLRLYNESNRCRVKSLMISMLCSELPIKNLGRKGIEEVLLLQYNQNEINILLVTRHWGRNVLKSTENRNWRKAHLPSYIGLRSLCKWKVQGLHVKDALINVSKSSASFRY